jgi:hypothetical protein
MNTKEILKKVKRVYTSTCQKVAVTMHAPTERQAQAMLFVVGFGLLAAGLAANANAQIGGGFGGSGGLTTRYNDARMSNAVNAILTYLEGTFGALIMVASGIGAILSAAFGQYRAALGCLVVAVGAFILRSFLATFFNDKNVKA